MVEEKVKLKKEIDQVELKIIYQVSKSFQNTINTIKVEQMVRTSFFAIKYNSIRKKLIEIDPGIEDYTQRIEVYHGGGMRPLKEISQFNAVKSEINILVAYIETKLGKREEIIIDILGVLSSKLRATFRDIPKNEKQVQDNIDVVLNVAGFNYLREQITIPYSNKSFKPDFTFENENTCLEVKFCNREGKEKGLIDEINADIQAYKTRYQKLIFLVYDLSFIRDVGKFKKDIGNNKDIYVEVIKH